MIDLNNIFEIYYLIVLIFRIYCYISIIILPFVLYNSFFESRYKPNSTYYHKKEWYYYLKVLWAKSAVKKYKKTFSNTIKNETDEALEKPRKLTIFMRNDTQVFYGSDNEGNSLYIRITLRENRLAESSLQIRLADGQVYQLPQHPLILLSSIPERKWQAGGLEIIILEPFVSLQITYNGFLRNAIRKNENDDTGIVKHCKFYFIWSSLSEAKFFPQEVGTNELAEAVAIEPWKNPKWINLLGYHTGYDQYGTIKGTFTFTAPISTPVGISFVSVDDLYKEINLKLSGVRTHRWGPKDAMHRILSLFGVDKKGFMFKIGIRSYVKGCKELAIGSAFLPNKKIVFIEDCDISLPDFIEDGVIPGAFNFSFKANKKLLRCTAFIDRKSVTDMKNEETIGYNGQLVKTKYIINGEEAQGYGVFWYRYQGKGIEFPPYIIRPGKLTIESEKKYVTNLTSPECRSIDLAGIKGTSLALLTAIKTDKFKTLNGFCILTSALDKYLEKNSDIKQELIKLNQISCGIIEGNLEDACKRVQDLFSKTPLPQLLQDLILRELTLLKYSLSTILVEHSMMWCWTVRTSTVHQHHKGALDYQPLQKKSFLDCFNDEDVMKAVVLCWAGIYDYNKVCYRRNFGLPIICDMAIIIQPTLDADISGTLTTQNLNTGDLSQLEINANHGLSIGILPNISDEAIISRTWENDLEILSTKIGSKSHKIIIGNNGITKVENNNNRRLFCLTKLQLLQIAKTGCEIEKALGKAVQIEWSFYKDELYILNIYFVPNNFNTPVLSEDENINIIFNSTDNLFDSNIPVCTLSQSVIVKFLDKALQRVYDGKEVEKCGLRKLTIINGKLGTDISQTFLQNADKNSIEELKVQTMLTTGNFSFQEEMIQEVLNNKNQSWVANFSEFYRTLKFCWESSDSAEEAKILSQAIKLTSPINSTAVEHSQIIKRNFQLLKHIIYLHTKINKCYMFYQQLFLNLIHEEPTHVSQKDLQSFLNHFSTSTVFQISSKVELLAGIIKSRNLAEEFQNLEPSEAVEWLEEKAPDCMELLEKIVEEFGARGINEFDLASEVWENNIVALIKIIQTIITKMQTENKNETDICDKLSDKSSRIHDKLKGKFLKWLDARLHNIFNRRSQTLEAVAVTVNKFRKSYLDLGEKLLREGKLPDRKLIFHLTQKEIEKISVEKQTNLVEIAMKRSVQHKSLKEGTTFEPQIQRIMGHTVVGGHVVGRACILENIKQIDSIQPGDILITKSLDFGWSPILGIISGLVCDTGSIISQGAIAIYKKNIPCIIVENATEIFKTGDKISIVGNTGLIEKIN